MGALKVILCVLVVLIAALVIWLVPITAWFGRLIVALVAVGVIVLIR